MEKIRINKFIAGSGICSRRSAEKYISEGRVKVNNEVVTDLSTLVSEEDEVFLDNKIIKIEEKKVYIMLNKPVGYVCTAKEQFGRPSILDIVKSDYRIFPVGRLDMDSEGLILLTNDGTFTNNVIHPKKHIAKTYEVKLKEDIDENAISKLENGVDIGGYITGKAKIIKTSKKIILITIYEGKNRQIRRMIQAINNSVVSLKRIAIGKLTIKELGIGKYKILSKNEIDKIFE